MEMKDLKKILKENKLRGYSHYIKPELIELLRGKGLIPEEKEKEKEKKKKIDERLTSMRSPRQVEITDLDTKETIIYPSIYKAGRAHKTNPGIIYWFDGKVWKEKYAIKILN